MEDIKKIQEFFSKPVKENSRRSPDFILTEPAEIKYTESFGSGIKAPGVLHHANEGVFLGAEGAYIIVLPGGTFYVDEDKEEAIRIYPLKDQSREFQLALDYTPFSPKFETWKSWIKEPKTLEEDKYNPDLDQDDEEVPMPMDDEGRPLGEADEVTRYSGFIRNPEDPDSEPFNPTGSVAEFREDLRALFGKFKGDLKNPEFIKGVAEIMVNWKSLLRSQLEENKPVANVNRHIKAIQIQLDQLGVKYEMSGNPYKPFKAVYKPINKDDKWYDNFEDIVFRYNLGGVVKTSMDEATKDEETTFHKKLDKLVHDTFGKRKGELAESNPDAELKVGDYQTKYFYICPGAKSLYQDIEDKVEDMGLAIRSAKLQDALFAIEAAALENGATEAEVFAAQSIADQIMAMAAMMGLDKEHSYIQGHVDKIKGAVDKEQVDEGASSEEKRMAMQAIKRFAKYRGVSEKEAKADLIRAVKELGSIEEAINEIIETIQAGKVLEEKLCKKGEAYRKRRMAAGEKSSAYLSGRAVKVCKGQISGRKKRKKRKSKK